MNVLKKDTVLLGVIAGGVLTVVDYALFYYLNQNIFSIRNKGIPPLEPSTVKLIALCLNMFFIRYLSRKQRRINTITGIIIATFIFLLYYLFTEFNLLQ